MKKEEESHQAALIQWFNSTSMYPCLLYHIPNGGYRNIKEAVKFKSIGVRAGVCDLFLSVPNSMYHGLYIEMKSSKGKLTENQAKFIEAAKKHGYDVLVCRDWEEGRDYILEYLDE